VFISIDTFPTLIDYEYVIEHWEQSQVYIVDTAALKGKVLFLGVWGGAVGENYDLAVEFIGACFNFFASFFFFFVLTLSCYNNTKII
jgi:hypothetical protein